MSRVETIGDATLYLGDCREILPTLSFSAIVSDPPYGISHSYGLGGKSGGIDWTNGRTPPRTHANVRITGDDKPFNPTHLLERNVPTILWGANHFADRLPSSSHWLVWDKRTAAATGLWDYSDCELGWCSESAPARIFRHVWMGALRAGEENQGKAVKDHPAQKPVALMRWCIEKVAANNSGAVICDPYMGSGSTGVACAQFGRRFVGVELDLKYFDVACRRVEEASRQPRLFDGPQSNATPHVRSLEDGK